jgi:hypothetical protein
LAVDDPLLSPFQLIDPVVPPLQNQLTKLQETIGNQIIVLREQLAAAQPVSDVRFRESIAALRRSFVEASNVQQKGAEHIAAVRADIAELNANLNQRVQSLEKLRTVGFAGTGSSENEVDAIIAELRDLPAKLLRDLQATTALFRQHPAEFKTLVEEMNWLEANAESRQTEGYRARLAAVLGRIPDKLVDLSSDILELSLIQARARAESITLLPVDLDPAEALLIASRNRYDWMNARAGLVDTWRLIEFNANDLQGVLNLVFSGDVRNVGDNPLDFRGTTGRLRVGAQFDAPLARVAERNNFRQAQIEYQQARRSYYTFIDRVSQALRLGLRSIELNEANFELRRAAVRVAIDQVEITRLRLRQPPQPGVVATLSNTTARDLVSALSDLQSVQNDFLSVWVNNEVERLSLDFNLGTMQLDEQGMWIDPRSAVGTAGIAPYDWLACRKNGCMPCDFAPLMRQNQRQPPDKAATPEAVPPGTDAPPLPPPALQSPREELPPPKPADVQTLQWPSNIVPDISSSTWPNPAAATDPTNNVTAAQQNVWPVNYLEPQSDAPVNPLRSGAE